MHGVPWFAAKPRQLGAKGREKKIIVSGALSNRKHALFQIRFFENGPSGARVLHVKEFEKQQQTTATSSLSPRSLARRFFKKMGLAHYIQAPSTQDAKNAF